MPRPRTWSQSAGSSSSAPTRSRRSETSKAWATVVVARAAIDILRSARVRRETYTGPWLPEPVISPLPDPADRVTLDDSVSFALLVVLESLTPAERTAYVLHDLFAMTFEDVATTVGRSPAAVRQLAARARKHIEAGARRGSTWTRNNTTMSCSAFSTRRPVVTWKRSWTCSIPLSC